MPAPSPAAKTRPAPAASRRAATRPRRAVRLGLGAAAAAALLALPVGCSKPFWRHNADAEVYGLSAEKANDPRWSPPRLDIQPDPRSRFFDPHPPDCEPLPPDDPAANRYMARMGDFGRIAGDDDWDEEYGYTPFIENPLWLARFNLTRAGLNRAWAADGGVVPAGGPGPAGAGGVTTAAYRQDGDASPGARAPRRDPGRGVSTEFGDVPDDPFAAPPGSGVPGAGVPGAGPAVQTVDPGLPGGGELGPVTTDRVPDENAPGGPGPLPPLVPLRAPAAGGDDLGRGSGAADVRLVPDEGEFENLPEGEDVGGANLDAGSPALPEILGLTLGDAIELAYIHNRQYQTVLEDVYLAALDLSFERFRFDVRFLGFGGRPAGVGVLGEQNPGSARTDTVAVNSNFGVSRLLPAGGQWVVELTNSTLNVFGAGPPAATASTISFSLVQPLLRGAGRKVNLEALTQAERDLLYAIRDLGRFRKAFFADTAVTGPGGGYLGLLTQVQSINNLRDNIRRTEELLTLRRVLDARRPRIFSVPLPGLPADVLDELDPATVPLDDPGEAENPAGPDFPPRTLRQLLAKGVKLSGRVPFPAPLTESVRYDANLKLLQVIEDLSEEEEQALLDLSADRVFADVAADVVTQIRVEPITQRAAQLESQLVTQIAQLRSNEAQLQDSLDAYKLFLGLPPSLVVTLDETFLEPFELIDRSLIENEGLVDEFVSEWAALDLLGGTEAEKLDAAGSLPDGALAAVVRRLADLNDRTRDVALELRDRDLARVRALEDDRLSALDELQKARFSRDLDRDERTLGAIARDLDRRAEILAELLAALESGRAAAAQKVRTADLVGEFREALLRDARGVQVVQTGLRVEQLALNPFDLPLEACVRLALENRLDLMNQQAFVTDARRRVELTANALQAVLNLRAEGDLRTRPLFDNSRENPFDFRAESSSFRLGVQFDTPLDRIAERNDYRASLIAYQRARRDYIAFEDSVRQDVRTAWRQLAILKQNFETNRQAVRIAAIQFDSAIEEQFDPDVSSESQFTLLNALGNLLGSSNAVISTYVAYERARVSIYRDMGLMPVGPEGLWRDPFYLRDELRAAAPDAAPGSALEPAERADLDVPDRGEPARPESVPAG